jgi:hypothetical protein
MMGRLQPNMSFVENGPLEDGRRKQASVNVVNVANTMEKT